VKFAIVFSCLISVFFLTVYSVVMTQIKDMEDFYGHMDQNVSAALSNQNTPEHPYVPQSLKQASNPIQNTPLQAWSN
jgi:predicted PurR-regulated permease PerM